MHTHTCTFLSGGMEKNSASVLPMFSTVKDLLDHSESKPAIGGESGMSCVHLCTVSSHKYVPFESTTSPSFISNFYGGDHLLRHAVYGFTEVISLVIATI